MQERQRLRLNSQDNTPHAQADAKTRIAKIKYVA
jgi:hypothetical protein